MTEHASQHVTIQAPPQRCYETVLDVERLSEWAPDIKEARVLARDEDGRPGDVAFRAAAMGRSSSYTLRYTYGSNPLRISWRLVEGDVISRMTGDYEFMPVEGDPDSTLLAYDLDVDLLVRLVNLQREALVLRVRLRKVGWQPMANPAAGRARPLNARRAVA